MAWQTPKTDWTGADGVRDTDFNRIEGNILELYNKAALSADMTIYVSTSGNDTTGNGSSTAPYRTITHALNTVPRNLNGKTVVIDIATGTYTENVVVKGFNDGILAFSGAYGRSISIYSLEVNSSIFEIRTITVRTSSGGITVTNGSTFLCTGAVSASDSARGLYVTNGSTCRLYAQLTVDRTSTAAIHAAGASRVYILNISGSDNVAVIISEEGSNVAYGSSNISATSITFISRTGGRITTGSGGL